MRNAIVSLMLLAALSVPVSAVEYTAPPVPDSAAEQMPETENFADGLVQLLNRALRHLDTDFHRALNVSASAFAAVVLVSTLQTFSSGLREVCELAGVASIALLFLNGANTMIQLGSQTILEISEYGKLLLPVMTAAMAAQGGISSSAALYTGTAVFSSILSAALSKLLLPAVYLFLALSIASGTVGDAVLKNLRDLIKTAVSWCLKTLLTVFTTYMSITGVISGTTDAAALKATKVAISSVVPVVGGILSDASEAVLVSAGLAKNAAGIYGIFAVLALFLLPFLKIGVHYLILKATFALSAVFGIKSMTDLIGDFATAMGLLLAMTGSTCLMQLISTVCFLKGVG